MDRAEQESGQARVRQRLVEPLGRRGLIRPGGMTKAQFAEMIDGLCAKLAYMTDLNLDALEEAAAEMASGVARDRFPIANVILKEAARIQPPEDGASPLIRAVFAARLGVDAIAEGWAPELLADLRRNRRWPGSFAVGQIRARADDALRRAQRLREYEQRGHDLTAEETSWQASRAEAVARCQRIADMARDGAQ